MYQWDAECMPLEVKDVFENWPSKKIVTFEEYLDHLLKNKCLKGNLLTSVMKDKRVLEKALARYAQTGRIIFHQVTPPQQCAAPSAKGIAKGVNGVAKGGAGVAKGVAGVSEGQGELNEDVIITDVQWLLQMLERVSAVHTECANGDRILSIGPNVPLFTTQQLLQLFSTGTPNTPNTPNTPIATPNPSNAPSRTNTPNTSNRKNTKGTFSNAEFELLLRYLRSIGILISTQPSKNASHMSTTPQSSEVLHFSTVHLTSIPYIRGVEPSKHESFFEVH